MKKSHIVNFIIACTVFLLSFATAEAAGSLSMTAIAPSATVPAGTAISFTVLPSGFTNPSYLIDDNFGGTTLSSGNINSSGNFSWTPSSIDIGTHAFTISASDGVGGGANIQVILSVSQPTIALGTPQPSASVVVGSGVSFSASVTGLTSPTYTLSDSFGGSLGSGNINSSGYFAWTPGAQDVGVHRISVTAHDAYGHSVNATQEITVTGAPSVSITSLSPLDGKVSPGIPVTFTVTQTGMTSPTYTVNDSYMPTTITNANLSSGVFSWTPNADETGTHNLFILVTDSATGRGTSIKQAITVTIPNVTITGGTGSLAAPGSKVSFGVSPSGFTSPTYSVSDSFIGGTVSSVNISASGYFLWLPTTQDIGDHILTLDVSDAYGRKGSTTYHVLIQGATVSLVSIYPSLSIGVGNTLTFTARSLNFTNPVYSVSDVFSGITSVNGTNMSTSGYFSWTAKAQDAGMHNIRVFANDAIGHSASTTATVMVGSSSVTASPNPVTGTIPPMKSKYRFTRPLSYGMKGSEVTELQLRLKELGYFSGDATGYFGAVTKGAVKHFQEKHALEQIGSVGPKTRAALNGE